MRRASERQADRHPVELPAPSFRVFPKHRPPCGCCKALWVEVLQRDELPGRLMVQISTLVERAIERRLFSHDLDRIDDLEARVQSLERQVIELRRDGQ